MHSVSIIGAGQLGSRHLQALQAVESPLNIHVVDVSHASLNTAKERFEAVSRGVAHTADFSEKIASGGNADVVIVATSANIRRQAVEELLATTQVRYLVLEKLLFVEPVDYDAIGKLLSEKKVAAWVNCPMRLMGVYEDIRAQIGGRPVNYRVTGSQFGLVTNAIHYLDHVAHLTGCTDFVLDMSGLDAEPVPSKRAGYLELNGTLLARFADGSRCEMVCHPSGNMPVMVEIFTEDHRFIVRESEGKYWHASAAGEWKWTEIDCTIPYQSQLTTVVVQELLDKGTCGCTSYEESAKLHLQLLEPLRDFLSPEARTSSFPFT